VIVGTELTPEAHLVCPTHLIDSEAIYCAIFRAQSVVRLIECNFSSGLNNRLNDDQIKDALSSIKGYLNQINILMTEA
jgi:hypothetical protein